MIRKRENFMVKLKNLEKNNNIGRCDIIPEDSPISGHITLSLDSGELIEYSLPAGYEWCLSHVHHAARNLVKIIHSDIPHKEYLVMWY